MSGQQPDPLSFEVVPPGRSAPDEHGRRRVHPLTPVVQGVSWWPAGIVAAFSIITQTGVKVGTGGLLLGLAGLLAVTALGIGVSYLGWQRLTYWFDDDGDLRVDSGVLSRNERRLQLSRLQSVDVLQPLLAFHRARRLAPIVSTKVNAPPTARSPFAITASAYTVSFAPCCSEAQAVPFHCAMRLAGAPPAVVNAPPATSSPVARTASACTVPFVPVPIADQVPVLAS